MPLLRRTHERRRNIRARRTAPKLQGRRRQDRHVMTAAPIPALAHDHDSPSGRGGMFPLTPPVVRRSQNGFPSIRRLGFLPRSALADRLEHARPRRPRRPTSALHRTPGPQIPIGPDPSPSPSQRPAVFLPRRLSDAGPSALAPASASGRRPKPLTQADQLMSFDSTRSCARRRHPGGNGRFVASA